jgi:hypothetical protein
MHHASPRVLHASLPLAPAVRQPSLSVAELCWTQLVLFGTDNRIHLLLFRLDNSAIWALLDGLAKDRIPVMLIHSISQY